MSQLGKIISRSFFMLCASLLIASLAVPSFAMDQGQAPEQTQQVDKGTDNDDSTVIVGMGAVAGFGGGDSDRGRQPPSTRPQAREIVAWTAAGVLGVCVLGLTGGWVGEHFTRGDCDPNLIWELCQQCGQACMRICGGTF